MIAEGTTDVVDAATDICATLIITVGTTDANVMDISTSLQLS